jgi:alpha-L-fucosidase
MATSDRLLEAYYKSIGNGANLLINLTPYTDGLIPENETSVMHELGEKIKARFGKPLASTDSTTGGWTAPGILELPLPSGAAIDHVRLVEEISLGQHVAKYDLEVYNGSTWTKIAEGQSIGRMHLHKLDSPVTGEKLRLRIRGANAIPTIREFTALANAK